MQVLILAAIAGFCLLMIVAGIAIYTMLTRSGPRFRGVIEHKIRELDPKNRRAKNENQPDSAPADSIQLGGTQADTIQAGTTVCRECQRAVTVGRFCAHCGSPLF